MKTHRAAEADLEVKEVKLGNCLDVKERLLSCLSERVCVVLWCHRSLIYVLHKAADVAGCRRNGHMFQPRLLGRGRNNK